MAAGQGAPSLVQHRRQSAPSLRTHGWGRLPSPTWSAQGRGPTPPNALVHRTDDTARTETDTRYRTSVPVWPRQVLRVSFQLKPTDPKAMHHYRAWCANYADRRSVLPHGPPSTTTRWPLVWQCYRPIKEAVYPGFFPLRRSLRRYDFIIAPSLFSNVLLFPSSFSVAR